MSSLPELTAKFRAVWPLLNERTRRLMAASEARAFGHGGVTLVRRACGLSRKAIRKGIQEIDAGIALAPGRMRFLLHDRDPLFSETFRETLAAVGVETIRLPPHSPNLNAFAERFVRSIKESCLNRLVLCGEGSLRRAVREFVAHYHEERNHQGLGNVLIFHLGVPSRGDDRVVCHERLGGLLKDYHRPAA